MTFFLSKFLWYFFNPFNLIIYLLFLALLFNYFKYFKAKKLIFYLVIIVFFITGIMPTGSYLFYLLEKNYHQEISLPKNIDGILILSGSSDINLTKEYNQVSFNESGERLTESAMLINKYPNSMIVFSGGFGHSEVAKIFFRDFKIPTDKIIFEDKSRNTFENIVNSKKIINPLPNEKWILVTSAFHMSRALNVAENNDWIFIPYAVDFRNYKKFTIQSWKPSFNFLKNINTFKSSSHEWLGLISYYLLGRSSKIF